VKVERGVATSEFRKRADYAFLAPNFRDVRFYVEAKKPHGGIDDPSNYFQTIRYGWNSHTPLAVLTDFEELRVLDCRYKPDIRSAVGHAVLKFHYQDYADKDKFRAIYHLFSRESVLNGSIESFAKGMPKISRKRAQRGVAADEHQSIDESFLQELDDFREELARAYKRKNPALDSEALTEVTQRTLDRLVFMRFLEDKLIESEALIEDLRKPGHSWKNFIATSRRLDRVYNGIIFKEHSLLDSDTFKVDENVFNKITQSLSHTGSPYDFNAIPIHILGSIYERFLGKVIVATDRRATVKEKPEVRKAGGVYYTPEYIVRYIVDNTVGKLIEGKTPREIQEMRFADIACGSGSFLLGVYDTLLRYHTAYYNRIKRNRTEGIKAGCIQRPDGALQLSLLQKRQILLNNIYGVDIDPQAVEVAQLSLYLKLLEDETIASAHQQLALRKALLPSLSENIVCGNSLIGWDITEGKLFDTADERGLNPMNFEDAFPEVMKGGGFDAIVGNPPYVRQETLSGIKSYLQSHYRSFHGVADLYAYFMEKSLSLLRAGGLFSYIVSSSFLRATYGEPLRRYLKSVGTVIQLVDFGGLAVFASAKDTYVCIPLIEKGAKSQLPRVEICKIPSLKITNLKRYVAENSFAVPPQRFSEDAWSLKAEAEAAAFEKIMNAGQPLGEYVSHKMFYGLKTGLNEAFVITSEQRQQIVERSPESARLVKPFLGGEDIRRYFIEDDGKLMIVIPYGWTKAEIAKTKKGNVSEKQAWEWLKQYHAGIAKHLESFEDALRKRQDQGDYFWELRPCDYYSSLDAPKIIFPDICKGPRFCVDRNGIYLVNTAYCLGTDDLYLLGLLNSRLFWFAIANISIPFGVRAGEYRYRLIYQYMERVPIRPIDAKKADDSAHRDRIVQLVDQMLEAKQQLAAARSEGDKTFYETKCATLDRQIDNLVYELYDLTPDEIAIVEGQTK